MYGSAGVGRFASLSGLALGKLFIAGIEFNGAKYVNPSFKESFSHSGIFLSEIRQLVAAIKFGPVTLLLLIEPVIPTGKIYFQVVALFKKEIMYWGASIVSPGPNRL